jgi:1-acyl-sn-glycerol-3-phosphate acyltransferase
MMYRIVWWLCWIIFQTLFRRRVIGAEKIPRRGKVIVASNHISLLDPPVLGTSFWRSGVYMAKEELFRNRFVGWFISSIYAFPVKRGAPDRASLKYSLDSLEAGKLLAIFPEGTRSETGELQQAEMGVGMIAYRSGAPVVPAWICGTDRVLPKGGGFRLARMLVVFGEPLHFTAPEGVKPGRAEYEAAAARIMAAIAELRDQYSARC